MCDKEVEKKEEAEAVREGVSKFSVCTCMYDMGCLCLQRESLSVCPLRWILETSLSFLHPFFSLSQFFLPVLFLFIFLSPACIRWVHSYASRIPTLRFDCTNYTSKLGNWISYSASELERENTGIIVTDRDTPTLWCHGLSGPVKDRFPIDKSGFIVWACQSK